MTKMLWSIINVGLILHTHQKYCRQTAQCDKLSHIDDNTKYFPFIIYSSKSDDSLSNLNSFMT